MMSRLLKCFATTSRACEALLSRELEAFGGRKLRVHPGGVAFLASLEVAYRACLCSRVASRVLVELDCFPARNPEELYEAVRALDWSEQLGLDQSFAVSCTLTASTMTHSQYAARRVKDAVVDQFRAGTSMRPDVDPRHPDVQLHLHVHRDQGTLSVDLAGHGLHRRGYRHQGGRAPIKESLAAAMLMQAGWAPISEQGGALIDPMCGSGTLLIEAALLATDTAPGLLRKQCGSPGWCGHDLARYDQLRAKLLANVRSRGEVRIYGFDADKRAVALARSNATLAGMQDVVNVQHRSLDALEPPEGARPGLVITNPPYGERLGAREDLETLYAQLGDTLRLRFPNWKAAVLTPEPTLARATGLRAARRYAFFNGPLACHLYVFPIHAGERKRQRPQVPTSERAPPSPGAEMLANRLRKNLKNLRRWAKRERISCYRVYDADLPEYAVAIDLFANRVHLQEYVPPPSVDAQVARARWKEAVEIVGQVLEVPQHDLFLKRRERQRGGKQHGKLAMTRRFFEVEEGGHAFLVNLADHLDPGLFLDQRLTRKLLAEMAPGADFLNLFSYTATATVYVAKAGARATTSVDLSSTYTAWARRNMERNRITSSAHRLVVDDSRAFLAAEKRRYDLIFIDPPTFSNSKKMRGSFEVQRDHVALITEASRVLRPQGTMVFSCNRRGFKLDETALADALSIKDITKETIPHDFRRTPKVHRCYVLKRR